MASWKLNVEDWRERERWDETTEAYEDAISRCATPQSPWVVVRADSKWYRNLVIAEQVVGALRPYRKRWMKTLEKKSAAASAAIAAYRAALKRAKEAGGKSEKAS